MPEKKVKKTVAAKTTKKAAPAKKKSAARKSAHSSEGGKPYNVEQLGQIFNKGMDLAEAGIGLGVNLVTRLGSLVKGEVLEKVIPENIVEKIRSAVTPGGGQAATTPQGAGQGGPSDQSGQMSSVGVCLSNRLPLLQGGAVSIPFSINNDSADSVKKIRLGIEGFIGETHKYVIDGRAYSVKPPKKDIAPMDFDKFVLAGPIPADAPEDIYHGLVLLSGEEEFRIPVMLVVSKKA